MAQISKPRRNSAEKGSYVFKWIYPSAGKVQGIDASHYTKKMREKLAREFRKLNL